MDPMFLAIIAFVGVSAMVGGAALLLRPSPANKVEDRLDVLTGTGSPSSGKDGAMGGNSVLAQPLDLMPGFLENLLSRFTNFNRLFEQADTSLTFARLAAVSAFMAVGAAVVSIPLQINTALIPVVALLMGLTPMAWLLWRRSRRLKAFAAQLPDALEMLARALRAGQSLAAGFQMVAGEMSAPIGKEFGRVFEEQNLGNSMEESLNSLTERVPNLDLSFFATAVILQRQTGGDLAEILDKIGKLIRERFQIWGQVQALTGEGRLSGIVLLALPPALFLAVYQLNPEYITPLFTTPLGKKMLAFAIFLQVLGAIVIKKIITIKV